MDKTKKIFLKLFSTCIVVSGSARSCIYDMQLENYHIVPNSFSKLFKKGVFYFNLDNYSSDYQRIIEEYVFFLKDKKLAFEVTREEIESFPEMNLDWDTSSEVSNAIVDVVDGSNFCWVTLIEQLVEIQCYNIQFRFFDYWDCIKAIDRICNIAFESMVFSLEFYIPFRTDLEEKLVFIVRNNPKVRAMIVYGASENRIFQKFNNGFSGIYFVTEKITFGKRACGNILPEFFVVNIPVVTEAHHHNTCLNRKISIDINGDIKNCPSMPQSFGNIKDTTLEEALNHPDFKKYWNIKKDDITKCKDCEFRYICTDCRAYIEDPDDIYSAPLKCGYDPYTGEWEGWSTNPLKQKAIQFYGMEDLVKKESK